MELLHIGLCLSPIKLSIYINNNLCHWKYYQFHYKDDEQVINKIVNHLCKYQHDFNSKIVIAGITSVDEDPSTSTTNKINKMCSRLWLGLDIIPCVLPNIKGTTMNDRACSAARKCLNLLDVFQIPGIVKVITDKNHNVQVDYKHQIHLAVLNDYKVGIDPNTWNELIETSKEIVKQDKKIIFFNSTSRGGGVSIIRHSTIRLFNLLGIKAYWYVMKPSPDVFEITKKKIHNVLQGVSNLKLTEKDKELHINWCKDNYNEYWKDLTIIKTADIIVIDDPQPCPLIPILRQNNKNAKIVYRSHIELRSDLINDSNTVQYKTWEYLYSFIKQADIFVTHPVDSFIPNNINLEIVKMGAITDPLDGLNKPLDNYSIRHYKTLFNRINKEQNGKILDFTRPYFIQICRFDPSKNIPGLIKSYNLFRQNNLQDNLPQLVITGHGSIDDPEGYDVHKEIIKLAKESEYYNDIHIVSLGPSDPLLNMILRCAFCAFQLSIREGFEIKVSEALLKNVPVIGSSAGGIPLQIQNDVDGYIVDPLDYNKIAELMSIVMTDRDRLSENSKDIPRQEFLTQLNVLKWNKLLLPKSE